MKLQDAKAASLKGAALRLNIRGQRVLALRNGTFWTTFNGMTCQLDPRDGEGHVDWRPYPPVRVREGSQSAPRH